MAEATGQSVLKRKVAAGRSTAPGGRPVLPAKALSASISRAADASMGLEVSVDSCSERIASLSDLLELLPEQGLLAVLEGPEDCQGIMAFDVAFLSGVIEKQMTGAVSTSPPGTRRVTRTDAALAADLIDLTLREFETSLAGREESRWASGFGYGSHVEDLRPLGLLMEDVDYRIFGLSANLESGRRNGQVLLALPAIGRGKVRIGEVVDTQAGSDPAWSAGLTSLVLKGDVRLEAVLHRMRLPIAAIEGLNVGDEIPIPASAIGKVSFAGAEHIPLGQGRLGQSQGFRAVRLGDTGNRAAATDADTDSLDLSAERSPGGPPGQMPPSGGNAGGDAPGLPALPPLGAEGDLVDVPMPMIQPLDLDAALAGLDDL